MQLKICFPMQVFTDFFLNGEQARFAALFIHQISEHSSTQRHWTVLLRTARANNAFSYPDKFVVKRFSCTIIAPKLLLICGRWQTLKIFLSTSSARKRSNRFHRKGPSWVVAGQGPRLRRQMVRVGRLPVVSLVRSPGRSLRCSPA